VLRSTNVKKGKTSRAVLSMPVTHNWGCVAWTFPHSGTGIALLGTKGAGNGVKEERGVSFAGVRSPGRKSYGLRRAQILPSGFRTGVGGKYGSGGLGVGGPT